MNKQERIILFLLASLNFTHIMDFMIMMPLGNFLMPHFNITAQQFSFLVAAYTFSAAGSSLTAASFVDRFDRKKVLLFAYIGFLVGTFFCAVAPTYGLLLSARIFSGIFGGLIGAQVLSIVADLIPFERRGAAMGIVMASFSAASVFGVPFGLYLSEYFSWHAPFFFVVALGMIVMPLLVRFIPNMADHLHDKNRKRVNTIELLKGIVTDNKQRLAIMLTATMMMGHFLVIPFLNPFMELNVGFTTKQTPLIYFVGGALTLFTSPIIGRIADKIGKFRLFTIMIIVAVVPIALITNMPRIPFYFVLCITGFWFVVSTGRAIPAQAIVSEVVPPARRGGFMNINSSIQQFAVGLASVIAGIIVVKTPENTIKNYDVTGYLSIAVILCCLLIAYYLRKAMGIKLLPLRKHRPTIRGNAIQPLDLEQEELNSETAKEN
ncbi:MAG: MFS transporter [Chitinophagales bacterium]|nr:MFS transporter [Chitinophagales bacterium]